MRDTANRQLVKPQQTLSLSLSIIFYLLILTINSQKVVLLHSNGDLRLVFCGRSRPLGHVLQNHAVFTHLDGHNGLR